MKFDVGSLVVEKKSVRAHTSYNVQKVTAILNGALLLEHHGFGFDGEITAEDYSEYNKPGSRGWRENLQRYQEEELFTPEEALAEISRLEAVKSKLDEEFGAVRDLIAANLQQAAELVETAASLAKKCDKDFEDLIQEGGALYKALDNGGWSHSTMRCKYG